MNYKFAYVDIGIDKNISREEIIGIFDLDVAETGREMADFLRTNAARIKAYEGFELPKSFALTDSGVVLSPLAAETIAKRCRGA